MNIYYRKPQFGHLKLFYKILLKVKLSLSSPQRTTTSFYTFYSFVQLVTMTGSVCLHKKVFFTKLLVSTNLRTHLYWSLSPSIMF